MRADARVVDVGGGVVPPARAGVHRARHEPDRAGVRRRLGDDGTVERRRERRRDFETETTIAPSVRELRTVAEHVVPPAVARAGDGGEGIVVGRAPRLVGEEALQQLLQRRELVEIDTAERVARQVRDRLRRQPAVSDLPSDLVACVVGHGRDGTSWA